MITAWMVYCALVAALCALAALVLERLFSARRAPSRGLWIGAILMSLLIPTVAALIPRGSAPSDPAAVPVSAPEAGAPSPVVVSVAQQFLPGSAPLPDPEPAAARELRHLESVLAWAWFASSLLVLSGALVGYSLLHRRGSRWPAATVDGVPVLISDSVGPAVLGFLRTRIVLPEWAVRAEPERRRLIVEHEREHVAARDPLLLLFGLIALVAAPWNAALWWQVRRLRLAIEIDCDARVLARHPDRALAYGSLLLEIGRAASASRLPLAAFSEPASSLERRIRAMTAPVMGGRRHLVPCLLVALLVLTSAAALPLPPSPLPSTNPSASAFPSVTHADRSLAAQSPNAEATPVSVGPDAAQAPRGDTLPAHFQSVQLRELVEQEYPSALREEGVEGYATVRFTIDAEGQTRQIESVIADRPAFAAAAERVVGRLEFNPAVLDGEGVPERVERFRIHFRLSDVPEPHPDFAGIDDVLRSALERHYPELLRGDPARLPYVFFVVDSLGQRVLSALDWVPPLRAHEPEAIRQRFPQLRDREIGPYGRRSVRLKPDRRAVEVFWAEVDPADEMNVERHGPFPLGALVREHTVPVRVMLATVASRHPEVHERGLPNDQTVWVVGTRTGVIRASGTAPANGAREEMQMHLTQDESRAAVVSIREARDGSRYRVYWTIID